MSSHCCKHCAHGPFGFDLWDHHCVLDGAVYVQWDDGKCPLCATAKAEREAIVKWLKKQEFADATENLLARHIAIWIERGEHLDGDDE